MHILVAPDKFKGSLTTFEVCSAIKEGLLLASPSFEVVTCPMADGGDGLAEVVRHYTKAASQTTTVQDPLGRPVEAEWLLTADNKTAVLEMAKASGLARLEKKEYNPLLTSTYGTGQLIVAALRQGAVAIVLGIGGSATNDGGMGMAAALGYRFLDSGGRELQPVGGNLGKVSRIDSPSKIDLKNMRIEVACDVKNRLLGKEGATHIYAPQKGADALIVAQLEEGMEHFATVVKRDIGIDMTDLEGGGAAGGLGAGCVAFLQASIRSGIEVVMRYAGLEERVQQADVVMTGEGKIDAQTLNGKLVMGVATLAKKFEKPVLAFCGSQDIAAPEASLAGIDAIFPVVKYPMEWPEAKEKAYEFLKDTAFSVGQLLRIQAEKEHSFPT